MTYEDRIDGNVCRSEYDSLAEFADAAARRIGTKPSAREEADKWHGYATFDDALRMARDGWKEELDDALELAESAVQAADKEHMTDSFSQPVWDVTGAQVDVGAYLAGTPECMIDYPLTETSKVGRVVTMVAPVVVNAGVSSDTIIRRGRVIAALALALSRLGHSVELWVDISSGSTAPEQRCRVKVKGVNDALDPAMIMFAYAHPAMSRRLAFAYADALPGKWGERRGHGQMYGLPIRPDLHGLPDETIILPELRSDRDVPNADEFLRQYLGELGLLAE